MTSYDHVTASGRRGWHQLLLILSIIILCLVFSLPPAHADDVGDAARGGGGGGGGSAVASSRGRGASSSRLLQKVTAGLVFVDAPFSWRQLTRTYSTFNKMTFLKDKLALANLTRRYELNAEIVELKTNMGPTEIVSKLCDQLLERRVNVVFYITTNDVTDETAVARFTVATMRFLRLPVVLWVTDNSLNLQVSETIDIKIAKLVVQYASFPIPLPPLPPSTSSL